MSVDSHTNNKIAICFRIPIPNLDNILARLGGSYILFKIDLRNDYHQIYSRLGDE